jgi:hypothetical protein
MFLRVEDSKILSPRSINMQPLIWKNSSCGKLITKTEVYAAASGLDAKVPSGW